MKEIASEGVTTKLLQALEAGQLEQATQLLDRRIEQLRADLLELISAIEEVDGGRVDDLENFVKTMRRASALVEKAQAHLARARDHDFFGPAQYQVRELQRGIVRYAGCLSELATKCLTASPASA